MSTKITWDEKAADVFSRYNLYLKHGLEKKHPKEDIDFAELDKL